MVVDPYVAAKASLRDNVKTLIAVFGGVAGVLLAGTPFSGYGSLELFSGRWTIASVSLLIALLLLGYCVRLLLFVLRPDLAYTNMLVDETQDREIRAVQKEFAARSAELLPMLHSNHPGGPRIGTVAELLREKSQAWSYYQDDTTQATRKEAYDRLADAMAMINHWSAFTRLHVRVSRGIDSVFWLGLLAVLAIASFVLASSPQKSAAAPTVFVVPQVEGPQEPQRLPVVSPVVFSAGKTDLSPDAVAALQNAQSELRTRPNVGVLLLSPAVGGASPADAGSLSRQRAERVAEWLRAKGGIASERILTAAPTVARTPTVAGAAPPRDAGGIVQLVLVPLSGEAPQSRPR